MPDLEDAEDAIADQEAWGVGLETLGLQRLARAARLMRAAAVAHVVRLDGIDTRLDALEARVAVVEELLGQTPTAAPVVVDPAPADPVLDTPAPPILEPPA